MKNSDRNCILTLSLNFTSFVIDASQFWKDLAEPFYGANSGEIISVSNFPYSMLDFPIEISKDDAVLNYEVKTDKVPALFSKVWIILEPIADKK